MTKVIIKYSAITLFMAIIALWSSPTYSKPTWIEYDDGYSYDKRSVNKVSHNLYEVMTLINKEKGYATIKVRINCKTRELFYGTVNMYDKQGNFLFSDDAQGFSGGIQEASRTNC